MMAAAMSQQEWHEGIIKSVVSGDTVVIRGKPIKGPPAERTLCLAFVAAPKLASRPRAGETDARKDEPFAWQSREALRKLVIGKAVRYQVLYDVPTIGREFGRVVINGKDVASKLVADGWLKTRQTAPQGVSGSDFDELVQLEQAAQAAARGVWTRDAAAIKAAVREPIWTVDDMKTLVDPKNLRPAVVEQVRDGSTVRMFLLPEMRYITVSLAGIRCPGYKKGDEGNDVPEPFADEAKFFTEARLLNRDVRVALQAVTNNMFLGTIVHPRGNISELLLREGMARILDWSLAVLPEGREAYRAAENYAKKNHLRLFREYVPADAGVTGDKTYVAKCVEIINPETIVVKKPDGSLHKLTLASIRQPRPKEGEERPKSYFDIPWMYEAREFLRKKLIGHKCTVTIDFVKPAADGFPEKQCATVVCDNVNVAEALVSKGYATVVKYKAGDELKSSQYDALYVAEQRAIEGKKGMHKDKAEWPQHRVVDTTSSKDLAKQFFSFLQRHPRLDAVCDHVVHGGRLKLYVPKQNTIIVVLLAGIKVPRSARPGEPGEPFSAEALAYTRDLGLQRNVEVSVDTMDKAGNYMGTVWVNHQNIALGLVENGLASTNFAADRLPYASELFAAEQQAQARRIGIWKDYVEPKEEVVTEDKDREVKYKEVMVTEVIDPAHVWVMPFDKAAEVEALGERLNTELNAEGAAATPFAAKVGDMCAARFSDDGMWYRAKVLKVVKDQFHVLFVDYGNTETAEAKDIAALPADCVSPAPVVYDVRLACIKVPDDEEWKDEATVFLREGIVNKRFLINEEYAGYVTLVDPDNNADVGRTMLAAGYVTVENRRERFLKPLIKDYLESQDIARTNRRNMWQYGDIEQDDAPDFGYRPTADKRAGAKK